MKRLILATPATDAKPSLDITRPLNDRSAKAVRAVAEAFGFTVTESDGHTPREAA